MDDPEPVPRATAYELAEAIAESVTAGASVLNMSVGLLPSNIGQRRLQESLDFAAKRGVLIVAAAGNQSSVGSSVITRHPWVIPVVSCDPHGRPGRQSNLGASIGRHGLAAPGEGIPTIGPDGNLRSFSGTSAAAPFVTGAIALLWSEFPTATASRIKLAVTQAGGLGRRTIAPPLLNAQVAYLDLAQRGLAA
jgi:subtilisin family serine protease